MDVTVCVATFGDKQWVDLAKERAIPSAKALGVPVFHHHGSDLIAARNFLGHVVLSEWLCFLDADDELEAGYFDAMEHSDADLRTPRVRYVRDRSFPTPRFPRVAGHVHGCTAECLDQGNWMVIGTLVRRDMFLAVGGFHDYPWSEDWDLWVRCCKAGATIEPIPGAVYRAHVRSDSRNRAPDRAFKLAAHQAIARANGLPVPA